MAIYLLTY